MITARRGGRTAFLATAAMALVLAAPAGQAQDADVAQLKADVIAGIDAQDKLAQVVVDTVFSYGEPAFQEFQSMEYLTAILAEHGFEIEKGVGGMPTAWTATFSNGDGKPVIGWLTDIDDLLGLSQTPGVFEHTPLVEGAPGHGEGHNTGWGGMVTGAIALADLMREHDISGTIRIIPGIAEELIAAKPYMLRAGVFDDMDALLTSHIGDSARTSYGRSMSLGAISVDFSFVGKTAHGAVNPWDGNSALDAVELTDIGLNFKREHMHPAARTHYVITNGGNQPNIVPDKASVWYYVREATPERMLANFNALVDIADGAALMTGTTVTRNIRGEGWPQYGNKALAEVIQSNMEAIGVPEWSEADKEFAAKELEALGLPAKGLATDVSPIGQPLTVDQVTGGASNDLGDIMWSIPTASFTFPAKAPGIGAHHWNAAISAATPIAHKGSQFQGKVFATASLDILFDPQIVSDAREFFEAQIAETPFKSVITDEDQPTIHVNDAVMDEFRPLMEPFYYDAEKYDTYLEQLGISYP